jgi:hypothetical protein
VSRGHVPIGADNLGRTVAGGMPGVIGANRGA